MIRILVQFNFDLPRPTVRQLWQKVVTEGKKALDQGRMLDGGKALVSSMQKLLAGLKEQSTEDKVILADGKRALIRDCCANDPSAIAKELQGIEGESATTADQLTEAVEGLQAFIRPQIEACANKIKEWVGRQWFAAGEGTQSDLLSATASPLLECLESASIIRVLDGCSR